MSADDDAALARRLWLVGEPIHALTYFAQPSFDAWEAAGLRGFWRGYFATRAAPFGAVRPEVVTASFYNFDPAMVAQRPAVGVGAHLTGRRPRCSPRGDGRVAPGGGRRRAR